MLITDVFQVKLSGDLYLARSTFLMTQTDGRTAYCDQLGTVLDIQNPQAYFLVTFDLHFSDRINSAAPSVTAPQGGYPLNQIFSNRDTDSTQIIIRKSTIIRNGFTAELRSLRWGFQTNIAFRYLTQSGTYQGFGGTIGNAPGQALYSLAFRP